MDKEITFDADKIDSANVAGNDVTSTRHFDFSASTISGIQVGDNNTQNISFHFHVPKGIDMGEVVKLVTRAVESGGKKLVINDGADTINLLVKD